jgi:hypothetical protein
LELGERLTKLKRVHIDIAIYIYKKRVAQQ